MSFSPSSPGLSASPAKPTTNEVHTGAQFHLSQVTEYSPQGDKLLRAMYGSRKSKDFIKNPYNPPDFGTELQVPPVGGQFYVAPPIGMPFLDPYGIYNPAAMVPFTALNKIMEEDATLQSKSWF